MVNLISTLHAAAVRGLQWWCGFCLQHAGRSVGCFFAGLSSPPIALQPCSKRSISRHCQHPEEFLPETEQRGAARDVTFESATTEYSDHHSQELQQFDELLAAKCQQA